MSYMCTLNILVLLNCLWLCNGNTVRTPQEFARLVSDQILGSPDHFIQWFYGGAIIVEGFYRVDDVFKISYGTTVDYHLDKFKTGQNTFGFKILHGEQIPWFHNVGDQVPLFAMNYLNRVKNYTGQPFYPDNEKHSDLRISIQGAYVYVDKFPLRIKEADTPCRGYGWKTEHNSTSFLWCDDAYMGLTPLVRAATYQKDEKTILQTAKQALVFHEHLVDTSDNLYHHGANIVDNHWSCCKWGRANGWALMAKVEILEAMEKFPSLKNTSEYDKLLSAFLSHSHGIKKYQAWPDGRWRQLINESDTFLETSATAMFLSSLSRGVVNDWLKDAEFGQSINQAWKGMNSVMDNSGVISGVCNGKGIEIDKSHYVNCSTDYYNSANGGLGTVLYAVTDYQRYLNIAGLPSH